MTKSSKTKTTKPDLSSLEPPSKLFFVAPGYVVLDKETGLNRTLNNRDEALSFIAKHPEMKQLDISFDKELPFAPVRSYARIAEL